MNKTNQGTTRRDFLVKSSIATAGLTMGAAPLGAAAANRVAGANEKVRMGFIGVGNRGTAVMHQFMNESDCEVAAISDIYEPYLSRDRSKVHPRYIREINRWIPPMGETFPNQVGRHKDYRRMLDDPTIDAVYIGTQDHWHALQTIDAIRAGKDVLVEKPLAMTIREGRAMIRELGKSNRVAGVFLNRRGASTYQKLAREIPAGKIGKVTYAGSWHVSNHFPDGIGNAIPEEPPPGFDWDLWLGPKPYRPYQYNIAPYRFRWWAEYDNQVLNNGVHFLDLMRWLMNEKAPVSVTSLGGKFALEDDRTIPDTQQTVFEFPSGALMVFTMLEASSRGFSPHGVLELRGTHGTLHAGGANDFRIIPTTPGQFQSWDPLMEAVDYRMESAGGGKLADGTYVNPGANIVRDFLDCVKSRRQPMVSLEDGHLSTNLAHLATIALEVKETLKWDAEREVFTNSAEANRLLHYEYRAPWKL